MTAPDLSRAVWRKSSRSTNQANCVEVAFVGWRKSSRSSNQGNCVEVAFASSGESATVAVRDSKNVPTGAGHVLSVPAAGWATFLHTIS